MKRGKNGCHKTYSSLHRWVASKKIKPDKCNHCGVSGRRIQWANKSHEYKSELEDWIALCVPCHRKHDLNEMGMKRQDALNKFPELKKARVGKKTRRLTKDQALEIFTSNEPQGILAKKYNLTPQFVSKVKNGLRYKKYTIGMNIVQVKPLYEKLSYEIAEEIRESKLPNVFFVRKYSVGHAAISKIKHGLTWKVK